LKCWNLKSGFNSRIGKVTILGDLNARCGQKLDYSADCSMFDKYIDTIDQEHSGNSHCDLPYRCSMDTVVNTSGTKLIEICLCSDLKLVNRRIGDDAGISSYTFMSPNGCSVIDYAVCSYDLFPLISDFIVHDLYSCYTKITGDNSKRSGFIESMENSSHFYVIR